MGWDAYTEPSQYGKKNKAFIRAAERVRERVKDVDWLLQHGGLDCSTCGEQLERATGLSVFGDSWSPELVKKAAKNAQWPDLDDPALGFTERWSVASAKEFLETAAKLGLGVRFTW